MDRSQKKASILFHARLFREGRLDDYWEAIAACRVSAPLGSPEQLAGLARRRLVVREFGYVNAKDEFERHKAFLHTPLINGRKELMAESQRNKGRSALDKAFDDLPNKASNDAEIAWVASHPKMRRAQEWKLQNPEEPPKPVKMTAADIASPSNGVCPSKVAYTTLVSWLANPDAFQKQMLSKQRDAAVTKGDAAPDADGVVVDDGLASLVRVHEQYLAQKKAAIA